MISLSAALRVPRNYTLLIPAKCQAFGVPNIDMPSARGQRLSSKSRIRHGFAAVVKHSIRGARSWVPLICLLLLAAYAAVLLHALPWVAAKGSSGAVPLRVALKLGLFRPSYCSALPVDWPINSSTAVQTSGQSSTATAPVPQAVVTAFLAVHAAAEQSLALAAAIWRVRAQPGSDIELCPDAKKPKTEKAHKAEPSTEPAAAEVVAPVVANLNLSAVLAGVGDYPAGSSAGRGIVVVGGGPKYTPAAFGCVVFIRRTGCQLPIEVWAPPHEPIPLAVVADFVAMGNVSVRSLQDAFPFAAHDNMRDRKFLAKQLSMLASQFQEILFLDADNIPLQDPAFLFDEPLYAEHGLLMWPDFWRSEAKPGAWEALGVPPALRPAGSHESGQVLLDKQRCWKALLLAIYFNMRGDVFYPLFSDMGKGDKETLPFAWLALGLGEYGLVQHGVLALGFMTSKGRHDGTAMLQRSPDGIPMFLHAHLPKINVPTKHLKLPPKVSRNWDVLTGTISALPPGLNATRFKDRANSYEVLNAVAGYDVEIAAIQLRRYLRCQPVWVACCMRPAAYV